MKKHLYMTPYDMLSPHHMRKPYPRVPKQRPPISRITPKLVKNHATSACHISQNAREPKMNASKLQYLSPTHARNINLRSARPIPNAQEPLGETVSKMDPSDIEY